MKFSLLAFVLISASSAAPALAQPVIETVQNNYSYILPGLPNYGIAQGSIFVAFGRNLANSSTALQSAPLTTTLNGVFVRITVSGTTTDALLYYVTPNQVAGILPSRTPIGTGQITVTNNGQTSAPAPITVVQSAFGILTLNGAGHGTAAAFDADYKLLGFTNAANPGDVVILWGSGAGPVAGDESVQQTPQNLSNVPVAVDVGGVAATVLYHGRSAYPGLDQVNIAVPAGVSGCYVSVVVRSGNYVSNFATIPVTASGNVCADTTTGLSPSILEQLSAKPSFTLGFVAIGKSTVTTPGMTVGPVTLPASTTTTESGFAGFNRYTPTVFSTFASSSGGGQVTSLGSCVVHSFRGNAAAPVNPALGQITNLNAGPALNVVGPAGRQSFPFNEGFYGGQFPANFIPAGGGAFTFDNGAGGPDVGAFTARLNMAAPLVWSNMDSISAVNRAQGVTVNWTGGDASGYVVIAGSSISGTGTQVLGSTFTCTAPATARQFTVPATVLLSLPASTGTTVGGISIPGGSSLSVSSYTNATPFTAPNIDFAAASAYVTASKILPYQ